jgi:hypothetical protein
MSNTKTVWKIRDASTTTANESPLEEGVWHIPAGTTEVEPPSFNSGTHTCSFNGTEWVVAVIPTPEAEPEEWEKMKFASEAQYDATQYSRDRQPEYPSTRDQLDMLWHAIDTGDWTAAKVKLTSFYTELKAVKDKYPKP